MFRHYRLLDFRLRLVVLVYAITILGILVIGSAAEEYQSQQLLGMILGTVAMLVLTLMDYRILLNLSWVLYAVNIILLLAVKFVGYEANGAKRWLNLGFMRFQPSELTKLILIIFFAYFFTKYKDQLNTWKMILASIVLLLIPLGLVIAQPHLSATITIAYLFCVLFFVAGLSYKVIGGIIAVTVPSIIIFLNLIMQEGQTILNEYQLDRIMAWLNPAEYGDDAYQQQNSIIAIGSGQLFGKGLYYNVISSL